MKYIFNFLQGDIIWHRIVASDIAQAEQLLLQAMCKRRRCKNKIENYEVRIESLELNKTYDHNNDTDDEPDSQPIFDAASSRRHSKD